MAFEIIWKSTTIKFYQYGSQLIYKKNNIVEFENSFIPSGEAIVSWDSHPNYQNIRSGLQLPLLQRGKTYRCRTSIRAEPENSFKIKIIFFSQSGEIVDIVFLKGSGGDFVFPKGAFSYQLQVINTGINRMIFENILLSKLEN